MALPRQGPAQGGKAGGSKLPKVNLSNNKTINKFNFCFYVGFVGCRLRAMTWLLGPKAALA
ncbi:hypothetical protein ACHEXL_12745 [Limnohabitans sp. yimb22184]|uniref:hypothetical protein n=1 Tax=Limnohabitans sp. YIMB22184 TaxID=3374104 RepID=UPI003A8645AA